MESGDGRSKQMKFWMGQNLKLRQIFQTQLIVILAVCMMQSGSVLYAQPNKGPSSKDAKAAQKKTQKKPPARPTPSTLSWKRQKEYKVNAPNVILITLDTLRADHMGCYGYERNTSPLIDAFAENADLYPHAFATSPWTLPTHTSLFTGKHSFEHGARTYNKPRIEAPPVREEVVTLAELFSKEGFLTTALTTNAGFLKSFFNLDQGFEYYHSQYRNAKRHNEHYVFPWLEQNKDQSFFLFLNYFDTHLNYNTAKHKDFFPDIKAPVSYGPVHERDSNVLKPLFYKTVLNKLSPYPEDLVQHARKLYDIAIRNQDDAIGDLFNKLKELNLYDNTLIILTSDHGENLVEHDLFEHVKDVYQPELWVPLIIKNPGQSQGRKVEQVISSVDIPAMIFDQMPDDIAGRNMPLFPYKPGNHPVLSELYYAMIIDHNNPTYGYRFQRIRTVLYEWPWKLIHSTNGEHELYKLDTDPGELENEIFCEGDRAAEMYSRMNGFISDVKQVQGDIKVALPERTQEIIDALIKNGYVGE